MESNFHERVITTSTNGTITVYDSSSGTVLACFGGSPPTRKGLALAGNNHIAATATASVHLRSWRSPNAATRQLPLPEPVAPLASTPDGSFLFAGGISGQIHAISLPSGDVIRSIAVHSETVSCFGLNNDGSILLSGSEDGTISVLPIHKLLDASSTDPDPVLCRFVGHRAPVTGICAGIGGLDSTVISSSLDSTCRVWSLVQATHLKTVEFNCKILGVAMDPLESKFYAGGSDGWVYFVSLNVASGERPEQGHDPVAHGRNHGGEVVGIATINEGENLVTASENGRIWIWDVKRRVVIRVFGENTGSVSIIDLVVGGGWLSGGGDGVIMGFSGEEERESIERIREMEEELEVAVRDRNRAIWKLEEVMEIYEKLLELILKEVEAQNKNIGSSCQEKND